MNNKSGREKKGDAKASPFCSLVRNPSRFVQGVSSSTFLIQMRYSFKERKILKKDI